jgi:hypothetical protein
MTAVKRRDGEGKTGKREILQETQQCKLPFSFYAQ